MKRASVEKSYNTADQLGSHEKRRLSDYCTLLFRHVFSNLLKLFAYHDVVDNQKGIYAISCLCLSFRYF
jgi:hypothetical protein